MIFRINYTKRLIWVYSDNLLGFPTANSKTYIGHIPNINLGNPFLFNNLLNLLKIITYIMYTMIEFLLYC